MQLKQFKKLCTFTWPALLVTLFIAAGSVLRLRGIGTFSFWTDELFHAIGAKSLLSLGSPIVPGIGVYNRAYPITFITAHVFEWFGISEAAARVPSVIFNILFILIAYVIIKRTFNIYLALIFTFVMSFSPFEIVMARELRMYSLFQLLYFLASMAFMCGFEASSCPSPGRVNFLRQLEQKYRINIMMLGIAIFLFMASVQVHMLTYNFVVTLFCYSFALTIWLWAKDGPKAALLSKYSMTLACIVLAAFLLFLIKTDFCVRALKIAFNVPNWATYKASDYNYYRYYLTNNYPALVFIYFVSIYFMIKQYGRRATFIFCSFIPLILMHTFVFGRKLDRYIFYIYPFFVLGASYILTLLLPQGVQFLKRQMHSQPKMLTVILCVALLPAANLFCYPWLGNAKNIPNRSIHSDWKSVNSELSKISNKAVIISTHAQLWTISYYVGRIPDYVIKTGSKPRDNKDITWINSAAELENIIKNNRDIWLIMTQWAYKNAAFVDEDMRKVIKRLGVITKHRGDDRIYIFKKR